MPECVFRKRLKNQVRDHRESCPRMNVVLNMQPIGKSHLLNTQIQLNEIDLVSQFNFLFRGILERVTQEIAQTNKHRDRRLILVVAHQTHDAVQRVEEEVRVQLHSQRLELRLCELRFETCRQKFALTILAIVVERVTDADHAAIDQQIRT